MVHIGRDIKQKGNYNAFIPDKFPPKNLIYNEPKIIKLLAAARTKNVRIMVNV